MPSQGSTPGGDSSEPRVAALVAEFFGVDVEPRIVGGVFGSIQVQVPAFRPSTGKRRGGRGRFGILPAPAQMPGGVSHRSSGIPRAGVRLAITDTPPGIKSGRRGAVRMREVSMTECVKAHAAEAAVIDVNDVEEYNRAFAVLGGTSGWVKAGHSVAGGSRVRH